MKSSAWLILLFLIAGLGVALLLRQHRAIEKARLALNLRTNQVKHTDRLPEARHDTPSPELLKLRNEVSLLNKSLSEATHPLLRIARESNESDWNEIHSGPKLSELPGFFAITNLTPASHRNPSQAFESFQFALRNQGQQPLTPDKMKEIWDVPDDFDDPNARYSISMGQGIGGETGYRIVREQNLSSNEVLLTIDFEMENGGSTRQERTLVNRNGAWRVKPERLSRAE